MNTGALYLVTDKRCDGRVRIIAEYVEPRDALEHARMLRWAGSPAEILVARAFDPNRQEELHAAAG